MQDEGDEMSEMLTQIEQDAMSAWDNEADTKGMDNAAQGAWDNACIYADTYGHDTNDFKATLLELYQGHIATTCTCSDFGGVPTKSIDCFVHSR